MADARNRQPTNVAPAHSHAAGALPDYDAAIAALDSAKVNRSGDTMTGALTAPNLTATSTVQGATLKATGQAGTGYRLVIAKDDGTQEAIADLKWDPATKRLTVVDNFATGDSVTAGRINGPAFAVIDSDAGVMRCWTFTTNTGRHPGISLIWGTNETDTSASNKYTDLYMDHLGVVHVRRRTGGDQNLLDLSETAGLKIYHQAGTGQRLLTAAADGTQTPVPESAWASGGLSFTKTLDGFFGTFTTNNSSGAAASATWAIVNNTATAALMEAYSSGNSGTVGGIARANAVSCIAQGVSLSAMFIGVHSATGSPKVYFVYKANKEAEFDANGFLFRQRIKVTADIGTGQRILSAAAADGAHTPIDTLTWASSRLKLDGENLTKLSEVQPLHGVANRGSLTLSYVSATRVLTITGAAQVYIRGVLYTLATPYNFTAHANTTGGYFFYLDASGAPTISTSSWDLTIHAPIAYVWYDSTLAEGIPFYELHDAWRSPLEHKRLHDVDGTQVVAGSGFDASGFVLNSDLNADKTLAISAGTIADEDIQRSLGAVTDGGPYTILHRTGASGTWTWTKTASFPFLDNGTDIEYNQFTGATWQRTVLSGTQYVNMWAFALPSITAAFQIVFVVGQAVHASQGAAEAESVSSLAWGTMPFQEIAPLYQLTYRRAASNGNQGKADLRRVARLSGARSAIATGSAAPTTAAAVTFVPAGNVAATNVQAAIEELDTEKVATTDSRLSDARTPTAHAASHAAAGSDPVTLAQSQITNLTTDLAGKVAKAGDTMSGSLSIILEGSAPYLAPLGAGAGVRVSGPAGYQYGMHIMSYAVNNVGFFGCCAEGTSDSPTATISGRILGQFRALGYDGVTAAWSNGGRLRWSSTENWNGAARGCMPTLEGVLTGTTALVSLIGFDAATGYASLLSGARIGGYLAWHEGNDGSGSGLDADTLDGFHGDINANGSTAVLRNASGYAFATYWNQSSSNDENPTISQVIVSNGADGYFRKASLAHLKTSLGSMTPTSHASSHQSGGGDAIKLDDLAAPDDNTDLDASTSKHGLLPKLGGGTTNFLRADGSWAAPPASSLPPGTVLPWPHSTVPSGFLACDGSNVSRTTYADLWTVVGATWGAGDGSTTFGLPDFRRRTLVGSGGTGTATLANTVGSYGGAETHSLVTAEMPAHTHGLNRSAVFAGTGSTNAVTAGGTDIQTASTGGSPVTAHNNMQPSAVVNWVIKT